MLFGACCGFKQEEKCGGRIDFYNLNFIKEDD